MNDFARLLAERDAIGLAELVERREVSAVELTGASIAVIEDKNPTLNAVITPLFDRAMDAAKRGLADGPFTGVPTLLKDLGATMEGIGWYMGCELLRRHDYRAPVTSYYTDKLTGAGFNILGKTNTPELGILPTTEPRAFGATRNPHDLERSTGGSSGGSAAAVAAGMVPVAHANDGGGSIRIPASACGLVGLKPSRGRLSMGPLRGTSGGGLSVELATTKSVRDAAAMLDVLGGPMPGDPYHAPPPARPFASEVGAAVGQLRVGFSTRFSDTEGVGRNAHPECVRAVERTAKLLESLGHIVEERTIAALEERDYAGHFMVIWAVNVNAGVLGLGTALDVTVEESDVEPLTWALSKMGETVTAGGYVNAWNWLEQNARRVAHYWNDFDLYLSPTTAEPAPLLGAFDGDPGNPISAIYRAGNYAPFTLPFNGTGQPGISLPMHQTDDGRPVGVQLVAPYAGEDLLIRVASQIEAADGFV